MSNVIDAAVVALNEKLGGFNDGTAKFVIKDEGAIMVDAGGARDGIEGQARRTVRGHDGLRGVQNTVAIYAARSSCHLAPSISIRMYLYAAPRACNPDHHAQGSS